MIDNNGLILFNLKEKSKNDKKKASALKVGIPQFMLIFKSGRLWRNFFAKLGLTVIISCDSSKDSILNAKDKLKNMNDLASTILFEEVKNLSQVCDFLLLTDCGFHDFNRICSRFKDNGTNILLIKNDDLPLVDSEEREFIAKITKKSETEMTAALTYASRMAYKEKREKKCILLNGNPVIVADGYFNSKVIEAIRDAGFYPTFEGDIDTVSAINFVNIKEKNDEKSFIFLPQTDVFFDTKGVYDESLNTLRTFLSSIASKK